ncbi:rhodanese-like domain-containing protein [Thermodesulforhabdus norvegica]|uniref:Rhodanese-related sulfurtransferase n=1 Tax=Thermodesulforhabdus norvegica TaxID=39841 RepID=A0A1I4SPM0_9BACT|nr:rhodanese-like domain-containing protein [Thermodesulforhabdus norvegica]SFM66385.1 Rhodanese-related sulfurtransferase [Thermodesulforhabdus norvegica]
MSWEIPIFPQEIEEIFPEELQELMRNPRGSVFLLDVRQPQEYHKEHLPGASLIPLPELPDRADELPRDTTIVVYCGSGKRSHIAARILKEAGFELVKNLKGGMGAWIGPRAFGEVRSWQRFLKGNESPGELIKLAYLMENNLEAFYIGLSGSDHYPEELRKTLGLLAGFEKSHKELLTRLYREEVGTSISIESFALDILEGGVGAGDIEATLSLSPDRPDEVLEFALTVEAQAYDFYYRCLTEWKDDKGKKVLSELAQAEKKHMRIVGDLMDRFSG